MALTIIHLIIAAGMMIISTSKMPLGGVIFNSVHVNPAARHKMSQAAMKISHEYRQPIVFWGLSSAWQAGQ